MSSSKIPNGADPQLQARLSAAHAEARRPLTREEVADIVSSVVSSLEGDISLIDLKLYHELEALAIFIQTAKNEIAAIRPEEIRAQHIPLVTDELDAVIGATEEATGRILDACEAIEGVAAKLEGENASILTNTVQGIYEACNFQDITGQRITKVVRALKDIEEKVDAILHTFGDEVQRAKQVAGHTAEAVKAPATDQDLLNGPQLPGNAIGQDEIDRLLASFD